MRQGRSIRGNQVFNSVFLLVCGGHDLARCPSILRIEAMLAVPAHYASAVIAILGDAPALRTDDLCLGLPFRIGVLREDVATKQRNGLALGSANRLDPEKIQDGNRLSRGRVLGLVVAS